jgi:hypothetical protein
MELWEQMQAATLNAFGAPSGASGKFTEKPKGDENEGH